MIKHIENENLEELVKEGTYLVDFYAEWCGPCQMLSPILENIDGNIIKVNIDTHSEIATKYGVMSVPTLIFFQNGEIKETLIGFRSKEELEETLKKYTD